jgi:HNH endonuclease
MHSARQWLAFLSAAVLAILLPLTTAPAAAATAAGTRVGAHHPVLIFTVGASHAVSADQGRCQPALRLGIVSGACVAAEDAGIPAIKAGSAGGETAGKVFSQGVRRAALDENPDTCVYCHMQTDSPQVDHAIPRSVGGNATIENAQTTCGWCNASKGARDFPVNPPPSYEGAWPPAWWSFFGMEP